MWDTLKAQLQLRQSFYYCNVSGIKGLLLLLTACISLLLLAVGNVVFLNELMEFLHDLFTGRRSTEQGKETEIFLG